MSPNRIWWSELDVGAGGGMLPNAAKPEPWTGYDAQLEAVAVRGTKVWKPRPTGKARRYDFMILVSQKIKS